MRNIRVADWIGSISLQVIFVIALAVPAVAQEGQPVDWQIGMQTPVTDIARQIIWFHDFVNYIIIAVAIFVLALLVYVIVRFNAKSNPNPSKTSHNTTIEIIWTVVPVLILLVIAVPSFRLLFAQYDAPKADLTIKAIGHQWYWAYEYPDHDDLSFDAIMLEDDELAPGQPRLLATDNDVVVPVNKVVHVLVTAADVIHNWTVPSFGSKVDAVPGRITKTWFRSEKTGVFYGQCSELCGTRHAFMPITVRVVEEDVFNRWVEAMKEDPDKAREVLARAEADKAAASRELAEAESDKADQ